MSDFSYDEEFPRIIADNWGLLSSNPEKLLDIVEQCIAEEPEFAGHYQTKRTVLAWMGRYEEALSALTVAMRKYGDPYWPLMQSRGDLFMKMGRFPEAQADYDWARSVAPDDEWADSPGPFGRAVCSAQTGNLDAVLAECAFLPDDFWTPLKSTHLYPGGSKEEIVSELTRRALAAKSLSVSGRCICK